MVIPFQSGRSEWVGFLENDGAGLQQGLQVGDDLRPAAGHRRDEFRGFALDIVGMLHTVPAHPGRLDGHMCYVTLLEPVGQPQQIVSEGPKAPLLFTTLPLALGP